MNSKKKGIIYCCTNMLNGKVYIGQTTQYDKRLKNHIKGKQYIDRAIRKYGLENFNIYKFNVPIFLLDYFEVEMIKKLNTLAPNGYNLISGGNKNKKYSTISRNKMSNAQKGKKHWNYGKKHKVITRKKMSESQRGKNNTFYGKKHSAIFKKKISRINTSENNGRCRSVQCIETKEIFKYIKLAAEKHNISISSICKCCSGKYKTSGGYHWRYYNE